MDPRKSSMRPDDDGPQVVTAATLQDALKLVRQRFGPDARVIRSRTVNRRSGLGRERVVEVVVASPPGGTGVRTHPTAGIPEGTVAAEITREVERIEALVDDVAGQQRRLAVTRGSEESPLVEALVAAGASRGTAGLLLDRCRGDAGGRGTDRASLMSVLARELRASDEEWPAFTGRHVFLGGEGCGKSEMVLAAASRLHALGKSTLVLNLLPRHAGEVRRLQQEASRHGYDAAILQKIKQLAANGSHFERYDVVLLDTPSLLQLSMAESGELQDLIGQNASMHRHLVVALDADVQDSEPVFAAARRWNCDWLALSRLDRTRRPGKILDLVAALSLPISLLARGDWPGRELAIASSSGLIELVLESDDGAPDWKSGAEAEA